MSDKKDKACKKEEKKILSHFLADFTRGIAGINVVADIFDALIRTWMISVTGNIPAAYTIT